MEKAITLTAAQIAAERLKLAQQRAIRAEEHLALQKQKELRHAQEREDKLKAAEQRASKQSEPTKPKGFRYISDETIDKRCLDRDLKIVRIRNKLAEHKRQLGAMRESTAMNSATLEKYTEEFIATAEEGAQQARLRQTKLELPAKIAAAAGYIAEYESEIKLFSDQIEQLLRANDDDKNLRLGSL